MQESLKKYKTVIGYGVGQYYEKRKAELKEVIKLDYLCDRKWEGKDAPDTYDGIKVMKREQLSGLSEALIIVFSSALWRFEEIKKDIGIYGIPLKSVDEIIGGGDTKQISGKLLKERFPDGKYVDERGNEIYFDRTIPDVVNIEFHGRNNMLRMGSGIVIHDLWISFGNGGTCSIGNNTKIGGGRFMVSGAGCLIGDECLLSSDIILRNHDSHHIFDRDTHKRINYPKDIIIEDYVWLGHRVTLLGGASIGRGSVVGEGAVTSSRFGEHVVVAGCPAKVVRENICWSRDNTNYFSRDKLEECICQEALRYL